MAQNAIKACIDRLLPTDMLYEVVARAGDEKPANNRSSAEPSDTHNENGGALELALLAAKKWENGRTLRVRFLGGEPALHTKVEQYAHLWSQHANIRFRFGTDPRAELRIAFQPGGSWSWIGNDALRFPQDQPTMNFGWLHPNLAEEAFAAVVLHEFGHALGCIHEHQNPADGIRWNEPIVYTYYIGAPNFWTREQIYENMFKRYARDITQFSVFDRESIMLYPIPKEHTLDGFEVGLNSQLSAADIAFISDQYPFDQR